VVDYQSLIFNSKSIWR